MTLEFDLNATSIGLTNGGCNSHGNRDFTLQLRLSDTESITFSLNAESFRDLNDQIDELREKYADAEFPSMSDISNAWRQNEPSAETQPNPECPAPNHQLMF